MKYIDAEKLIAEIERRIEETKSMKPAFDQFWAGQISAFKGAIKITESLQQEQPEVELEKLGEIARHLIAVKDHEEDMRLDEGEWLLLERIGHPERFNARKEE